MNVKDIQQAVSGFRTVDVIGGPCVVRVHEALDAALVHTKHRYFISVDFKFRQADALNIGNPGYLGQTKGEATREARELSVKIATTHATMLAVDSLADTPTNRITKHIQTERHEKVIAKYSAEILSN